MLSKDNSTFFVFVNDMDCNKFNKAALFNLVDTAEKASSECNRLVFIMAQKDNQVFESMENMFSIIDAYKMSDDEIESICNQDTLKESTEQYAFFELAI